MSFNWRLFKLHTNSHVSRGNELVKNYMDYFPPLMTREFHTHDGVWNNEQTFHLLSVPWTPRPNWSDYVIWIIVEHMYKQVLLKAMIIIQASRFISITCNKIIIMDNTSWVSIHAYVVQNWNHISILISLDHASCEEQI